MIARLRRGLWVALWLLVTAPAALAADPLASWNEGTAKAAILDFVQRVTAEGGPDFVPVAERIAVFDNDGTLWVEQPAYVQVFFIVDRVKALAPQHPEWKTEQPFADILAGNLKGALSGGEKLLLQMVMATHAGMTTDAFAATVSDWLATARHPRFGRPFNELGYKPMVELIAYLQEQHFKTYIVSGGGVEFMRPWTEQAYGIPPEQVVGSSGKLKYELKDGVPVIEKLPELDFVDDGPGKPVGIQKFIGRRPILAFGNSDGDFQMLQWTTAGDGPRLGLLVHHDDAEREYAYDRQSEVGHLEKALDAAGPAGWIVVSMKRDWSEIFAP